MKHFFEALVRAVFSRYTLALLALLVSALAVWFLGPLLSFGGLRPFNGTGVRATTIGLLLVLLLLLLLNWSTLPISMVVAGLLIWHAGPLLAVGDLHPLAPAWIRLALIVTCLLVFALYGLYRLYHALRADEDLVRRWLHPANRQRDNLAKEEIKTLAGIVRRAVEQLRQMRTPGAAAPGFGALRRLFEGKRYLYELPWYMIVGVPGSGKTTALLNSGCKFPIAQQMGSASAQIELASNAGTVNTHWWFTNEAVLIDTAGRYTQQDDGADAATHPALRSSDARLPEDTRYASLQARNGAEWQGYLGLLRKHRARAPINGALVTVSLQDLVELSDSQRTAQAASLRERLAELRRELGVRFPVYLIVTKADLLQGFSDYFSALTTEGRSQVWGLTLPWQDSAQPSLGATVRGELLALRQRLEDGLPTRLQEEFDLGRRRRLYALPQELGGVIPSLCRMVEDIFQDSRFDATELTPSLRGIYLTSAQQSDTCVVAEPNTLMSRVMRTLRTAARPQPLAATVGNRSFFIHDVLSKLVFREAHLVRPNLGWEARFRLMRLVGHALVVVAVLWLGAALMLSYQNNRRYLADVGNKADALGEQVGRLFAKFRIDDVPDTLSNAQTLPAHHGLDPQDPPGSYRYGLYTAPPILDASADTYAHLQDQMLLPQIVRRMENALSRALVDHDERRAFDTLRVYLMLHDKEHYRAEDVKAWVLRDWQGSDGARTLGNQAALLAHVESLFTGSRVVQSPLLKNEGLVKRARGFLDGTTSTARLYERARAAMSQDAPPDFTLLRVIGPQAGTVFTRLSGQPLERGVPGLYTYQGYHELFSERLPEMIAKAETEDAWVMGTAGTGFGVVQKKTLDEAARLLKITPLMEDIRRQYLSEYAEQWAAFLADIAPITGTTLAFDLNVLRQFAAPDSPLARLARAAVRETTLSRSLEVAAEADKTYLDKASEQLNRQASQIKKNLGLRPEAQLERQLVDNPFAALREVVTGQSEAAVYTAGTSNASWLSGSLRSSLGTAASNAATLPAQPAATTRPALDGIAALVNDFYTVLAVADTAIANNSLPPAGADPGARMRMEAARLPAPFKEVLTRLAGSGSDKVVQGTAGILRVQAQAQLDRLLGMMAMQVSEPCKRAIEGRYPFVPASAAGSAQEVNVDDFNALFAAGGAADEYFSKYLSPFVDTGLRPWRYKSPAVGNMMVPIEAAGNAATPSTTGPTLTGELLKLLAAQGPNPELFARMAQIRDVFFREAGSKKMSWKMDIKVLEVDPSINELVINLDGQGQRYVHGPVQPFSVTWPGPRGGSIAELTATPRVRPDTSTLLASGPWALMRLVERGRVIDSATLGRASVEFIFDGRRTVLDINTGRLPSPLNSDLLRAFHCPGRA